MTPDPLATPRRIAFAGDWHTNAEYAHHAIGYAAEQGAQVLIHVGDFGFDFPDWFLREVQSDLKWVGHMPLLFVDGNHDHHAWINRCRLRPNGLRKLTDHIWYLPRGFRWEWSGVRFLALGGAYSVDRTLRDREGLEWWLTEVITDEDVARCVAGGLTDVLVSHDCPAGVKALDLSGRTNYAPLDLLRAQEHRELLRTVVEAVRPRFIFHGHYHRSYRAAAYFNYGAVSVAGLDRDKAALDANVLVVDLDELRPAGDR